MSTDESKVLIRRCAVLVFEPQETVEFDLQELVGGGDGLRRTLCWQALAPHLGEPVAVDARQRELLRRISPSAWTALDSLGEERGIAEALLDSAASSAKGDPEASMRVNFLQLGLQHAKLCSQAASKLTLGGPESSYERGKPELQALLEFRRAHERMWISNLNHCAWVESSSWTLPGAAVQLQDPDPE